MVNTTDDVITGALAVLDRFGLEFCSMRRVAEEVGVGASALYHHVPDKQTLLARMADRIIAPVLSGGYDDPEKYCRALRDAMLDIRDGAEVVATASAFRLGASELEQQLTGIFHGPDAQDRARTVLLYVYAHTQATQMHAQASAVGIVEPDSDLEGSFERGLALIIDQGQQ